MPIRKRSDTTRERPDRPYSVEDGGVWRVTGDDRGNGSRVHVCDPEGRLAVAFDGDHLLVAGECGHVRDYARRAEATIGATLRGNPAYEVVEVGTTPTEVAELNAVVAVPARAVELRDRLEQLRAGVEPPVRVGSGRPPPGPGALEAVAEAVRHLDFHDAEDPRTHAAIGKLRDLSDHTEVEGVSAPPEGVTWEADGRFHGVGTLRVLLHGGRGDTEVVVSEEVEVEYEGAVVDGVPVITAVDVDAGSHVAEHARPRDRDGAPGHAAGDGGRPGGVHHPVGAGADAVDPSDALRSRGRGPGGMVLWVSLAELGGGSSATAEAVRLLGPAVRQPEFDARFKRTGRTIEGDAGVASLRDGFGKGTGNRRLYLDGEAAAAIAATLPPGDKASVVRALATSADRDAEHAAAMDRRRAEAHLREARGAGRARD